MPDREVFADNSVKEVFQAGYVFSRPELRIDRGKGLSANTRCVLFPNLWLLDGQGDTFWRPRVTFDLVYLFSQFGPGGGVCRVLIRVLIR